MIMHVHVSFFKKEKKKWGGRTKKPHHYVFICLNLKQLLKGEELIENVGGK